MNTIVHLIPFAELGGCERNCYNFILNDKVNRHLIVVLDREGPMSSYFGEAADKVFYLDVLKLNPFRFAVALRQILRNLQFSGIISWSNMRLPFLRYATYGFTKGMAVHVGNPVSSSGLTDAKNIFFDFLFQERQSAVHLFPCSRHVAASFPASNYYRQFPFSVALNPVVVPEQNKYIATDLKTSSLVKLGMVARLDPIKDHLTLLNAFELLLQDFPLAQLFLIGDGVLRAELERIVQEKGVDGKVIFKGNVENVFELLQELDIFIYSTTEKEGLGIVVCEALAYGLPVLANDLPMLREIDGGEDCIFFYESKNFQSLAGHLKRLILDKPARKDLSVAAYKRASEGLSPSGFIKAYLTYLNND